MKKSAEFPESYEMIYDIPENGGRYYYQRMVKREAKPVWTGALHESIRLQSPGVETEITILHRKLRERDYAHNIRFIRKMLLENVRMDFRLKANCWLDCYLAEEPEMADTLLRSCRQQAESGTSDVSGNCLLIADVQRNQKRYGAAAEWYELALLTAENDLAFGICQQLMKCFSKLEQWNEAWDYNKRAMALRPESRSVRLNHMALDKFRNGARP